MVVPITSLWLPILIAAVLVFVVSSIIHMFMTYHRNDYAALPDENRAQDVLRGLNLEPGDYMLPYSGSPETRRSEAYLEKVKKGPIVIMTVIRPGMVFNMAPQLTQWFAYALLVGIITGYLAGRVLEPGVDYLQVFRVTGTVAFACYSMARCMSAIE